MKLLLVTVVEEFKKDILKIFKKANIDQFSGSDINGYKELSSNKLITNWFPAEEDTVGSTMLFTFTDDEKIENVFELIKAYNNQIETNNPIKAIVIPVEKWI